MKSDIVNNLKVYSYPKHDFQNKPILEEKDILTILDSHQEFILKFNENIDFFIGKNKQINYQLDVYAPDNQINVPYSRSLTNTIKGYMFKSGNIKYSIDETIDIINQAYFDNLKQIFQNNKEENKNSKLGEDQSKFGIGFELLYLKLIEGKTLPYFSNIDPREIIPIFDYSIEENLSCAIRYYNVGKTENNKTIKKLEIYYPNTIQYYNLIQDDSSNKLELTEELPNYFYDIPLVMYKNNDEYLADYEPIKHLISLYDKLMSDSANELDRFASAYLVMQNYILGGNSEEAKNKLENLKRLRVFEIDADGDIKFLTKDIPVAFFQEIKTSLKEDIIYHSQIPDFTDSSFGTSSGIAIKYKLLNFENLCAGKEAYFKEGLERRIKLINNFLKVQADSIDIADIKITFTRNLPENYQEIIDAIIKLKGIISDETLLSLLPFIGDVNEELEKIKKQEEEANAQFDIDNMENADNLSDNNDMSNNNVQKNTEENI